jgi:hypothetical protein
MTERLDMIGQQKMLLMLELQVWSAPSGLVPFGAGR